MSDYRLRLLPGETLAIRDARGTSITNKGKTPIFIGENVMADRSQNSFILFIWLPEGKNGVEKEVIIRTNSILKIIPSEHPEKLAVILLNNGESMLVKERFDSLAEFLTEALD